MNVKGENFSPIQHLLLSETSGDRKLDFAILQNIVNMVSIYVTFTYTYMLHIILYIYYHVHVLIYQWIDMQ